MEAANRGTICKVAIVLGYLGKKSNKICRDNTYFSRYLVPRRIDGLSRKR